MRGLSLFDTPFISRTSAFNGPNSIAGLVRWYKADSYSLPDGTAVGGTGKEWIDQSSAGINLVQATGGSQPVFKTNIQNGNPIIRFNGSNFMTFTSTLSTTNYTIIGVASVAGDCMLMGNTGVNVQIRIARSSANVNSAYHGNAEAISSTFSGAVNSFRMMTWQRSGSLDTFFEQVTSRGSGNDLGNQPTAMDCVGKTSFGANMNGDLAELLVYNTVISGTDLANLYTAYLKPKWNLP